MKIIRTNSEHSGFVNLVSQLNKYLKTVDGNDHDFYMQYNGIDTLNHVVIVFIKDIPVACGAFKAYSKKSVEIKRMFTLPDYRGQQLASKTLNELEIWAAELGFKTCILETGKRQVEAVNFYKKNSYQIIGNFGPYIDIDNSICFEKELSYAKR
ncbi:GNAT family N-acetyltransferase [Hyunsoonleella pacifica]|uniref:N-acetyltransferase n=1 Tax=Hyunsoonleella pacifica TaxID=1080224 RepID=A0A4Q9FTA5_9FLAO|nr:GNAT family N-acetyltransferase [Hyunsoonleella pacifica]TBN17532.1 N-acetyltransferase [Hyunsoonleella pacifica]GGD11132.1 N-acetyltransferase [Hyunsoonleella pacifica]